MDWLQNLLFDENSIAHIVLLYSFVIAVGVLLGKIKFFGVSLGVTFVLFTGIVCGHFGLTGNTQILTFLQDFGLILFVFCIGLQVGPSFFSSFKKGGIAMNLVAMGIVALNIAVAVALYYGGYSLWCSNEHAGTGCCQRSVEPAELQWPADSDGICMRLSIGSAGYHWFYYCYPLHLPD